MYQQINMYQPVFRQQPKLFSTATLLMIIAMVAVMMIAVCAQAYIKMNGLQRISDDLSLNYSQLDVQLGVQLGAAHSANDMLTSDAATSEKIAILQDQIDDRNALLDSIDSHFINTTIGFGDVFETLAKTNLPGLWLTGVQINQNGTIEISGTTIDQKLVPRYLQSISAQSPLSNLNNGTVNLTRQGFDQREINFKLSYITIGEDP